MTNDNERRIRLIIHNPSKPKSVPYGYDLTTVSHADLEISERSRNEFRGNGQKPVVICLFWQTSEIK